MARPTLNTIGTGIGAWDADVDDNFSIMSEAPLPLYWETAIGSFPSAGAYDDCIGLAGTSGSARIYISNGSTWNLYDPVATYQADSTATDVAGLVSDLNTLLGKLRTAGIMAAS
jgi:hypothetical protein